MSADLITCKYCGVTTRGHRCPHKTYKKKTYNTEADKFRKSKRWTAKSIEVRQRDRYLLTSILKSTMCLKEEA